MSPDDLGSRLRALEDSPLHSHPETLESVHRALVDELDALAGAGSVKGSDSR